MVFSLLIDLYIVSFQDSSGRVLDKWLVTTREEEQIILQQFLRFGETKSIAQEIILQDSRDNREKPSFPMSPKSESEIKKFIERSNVGMQSFMRGYDPRTLLSKAVPFPASAANVARLLTPVAIPAFPSPTSSAKRDLGGMLLPVSPANALAGSPLTRLQTMQPFDFRREHISPTLSPSASEKSASTNLSEHRSPQNLSLGALTPSSMHNAVSPGRQLMPHTPVKAEMPMELKFTHSANTTPIKHDLSAMDGVLNFSMKDQKSLVNTPPRPRIHSPAVSMVNVSPKSMSPRTPPSHSAPTISHYAEQKIKHLRKSSNPMKRPWQPTPGYGGTLISPSGKKRVLCTACNKTFCDKGALKIHYSAVHLKEMHKCSVDGCNMMFSSRRSRNRHSANPNPKLHMPQARRKLTDDPDMMDDIIVAPQHMPPVMPGLIPGLMAPLMGMGDTIQPPPAPVNTADDPKDAPMVNDARVSVPMPAHPVVTTTNASGEMIYYLDPAALAGIPQQLLPPMPPKLHKNSDSSSAENSVSKSPVHDGDHNASVKERSSRKRKCLVPTRCAQMEDAFVLSDDDGMAVDEDGNMVEGATQKARRLDLDDGANSVDEDGSQNLEDMESDSDDGIIGELFTTSGDEGDSSAESSSERNSSHEQRTVTGEEHPVSDPCHVGSGNCGDDEVKEPSVPGEADKECQNGEDEPLVEADTDDEDGIHSDSSINGMDDFPVDKDNPKKCPSCGQTFQNLFSVKTHYQNVHLKLMHTCSVDGCNAAFPSKRSRDRHSSNLNLHRKLLSTSTEADMNNRNLSLRDEFLPRIYDQQQEFTGNYVPPNTCLDNVENGTMEANNNHSSGLTITDEISPVNGIDMSMDHDQISDDDSGVDQQDGDSDDTEVYNSHHHNNSDGDLNGKDFGPDADPNGDVSCHVCNKSYRDNLVLKEHFEKNHPKEMFRCSIQGCDKIFSTRKSRNRHSQNDNLHRHISPVKINGAL